MFRAARLLPRLAAGARRCSSMVAVPPAPAALRGRPPREPATLAALPLVSRPYFPKVLAPLVVTEPAAAASLVALRDAGVRHVGLFLHRDAAALAEQPDAELATADFTSPDRLHRVGVLAELVRATPRAAGVELTVLCHHRIRWSGVADVDAAPAPDSAHEPPPEGAERAHGADGAPSPDRAPAALMRLNTEPVPDPAVDTQDQHIKALTLSIVETMKESLKMGSFFKEQLELLLETVDIKSPGALADLGASLTTANPDRLQAVLEEQSIEERLRLTLALLKEDLETARVSRSIHKKIEESVSNSQKRFFLTEQLKHIKRELGMEKDEKDSLVTRFRARLDDKHVPAAAQTVIDEAFEKLANLEPTSSEFNVARNHLDWLTQVPWGKHTVDSLDLARAQRILDDEHYGLKDVKERVLEFVAVSKLRGSVQGSILLLSGPPGVGKTSVAGAIAKALNREFFRFSVGGLSDVSEIKGHRRTYVGAVPGRFVTALKTTQTSNPVICLDELDKIGRDWRGDPSSALLEALDPEQNSSFMDHFLDTPIDLSKVLFICTANTLDTIPAPLFDRMQHIPLSGYILEEKMAIAEKYLIPEALKEAGLGKDQMKIAESAVRSLARDYCREAGVRNLKNQIEKIFRKSALRIAREKEAFEGSPTDDSKENAQVTQCVEVTDKTLHNFVGKPVFSRERMYETTPPGIAMGLAWTSVGGQTLYIEAIRIADRSSRVLDGMTSTESSSKKTAKGAKRTSTSGDAPGSDNVSVDGRLKVTGQLGDVMRESSDIAFSYVRSLIQKVNSTNRFFDTAFVHVHAPSGGTPKDGPSAGCAMVSAMLSLALDRPLRRDLAMTGEITLTGKVLPVGGIYEKVVAAKQADVQHVIIPKGNVKDWEEVPEYVREGLTVHFASHYEHDVLPVCFEDKDEPSSEKDSEHASSALGG